MSRAKGIALGLIILLAVFASSGFYTLKEHEAAINVGTVAGIEWGTGVATYDNSSIATTSFGKIHWRPPWPLALHHKVSLEPHEYKLSFPMVFSIRLNQYTALTKEGFVLIEAADLYTINVMVLHVQGEFKIANLRYWATVDMYGYGDEWVELRLTSMLEDQIISRIDELYSEETIKNPELNARALFYLVTKLIIDDPDTLLKDFRGFAVCEDNAGVKFLELTEVWIVEEPLSEYL